ncbi:MAG: hypothetical protein FWG99_05515 [Treponema sp.]|nr:hypothetical protein [Treponema sp.]
MNINLFISAFSMIFCLFVFFYVKWYIKRRTSAEELLGEYRSEVYRLIAEIDAATDRDSMLVEDRIKTLNALLEDTDKRITVYLRELERSRSGQALYNNLGQGIRSALRIPPAAGGENTSRPESQKWPELLHVPVQPAAQIPQAAGPAQTLQPMPTKQQIRVQVADLAAQGLSPGEIASRLDLSLSEVDLAFNLLEAVKGSQT